MPDITHLRLMAKQKMNLEEGMEYLKTENIPMHFIQENVHKEFIVGTSYTSGDRLLCKLVNNFDLNFYTNKADLVTCQQCLEWLHA